MRKLPLFEQRIQKINDTTDNLVDIETLDIDTQLLKLGLKETLSNILKRLKPTILIICQPITVTTIINHQR